MLNEHGMEFDEAVRNYHKKLKETTTITLTIDLLISLISNYVIKSRNPRAIILEF